VTTGKRVNKDRYEHYYSVAIAYTASGSCTAKLTEFHFNPRKLVTTQLFEYQGGYAGYGVALSDLQLAVQDLVDTWRAEHDSDGSQRLQLELPF